MRGNFTKSVVNLFGLFKVIAIAVIVVSLIVVFVGSPLPVSGYSMEPNFNSGEIVLVERSDLGGKINRGDVVEAKFPADPSHTKIIKRVIGLPGDTVSFNKNGYFTVNGQSLTESYDPIYGPIPAQTVSDVVLGSGEYFLAGDNRPVSSDSRVWGPVQLSDIQGKVRLIIWPLNKIGLVNAQY